MSTLSVGIDRRPLVLSDLIPASVARNIALVVLGAAFTGLMAQVVIPVPGSPVPITGQTLAALLVGTAFGWQLGMASMSFYLAVGVVGMPWFADGAHGISGIPSFGYIIGFIFAAAAVGALAARGGDRTPLRVVGTMLIGNAIIYACGVPYLMASVGVDLGTAWEIGVQNYLIGDAFKILLAAGLLPAAWLMLGRGRGRRGDDGSGSGS